MTDAHYHRGGYATFLSVGDREFCFYGVHPWEEAAGVPLPRSEAASRGRVKEAGVPLPRSEAASRGSGTLAASTAQFTEPCAFKQRLRAALEADAHVGVGEIGLDRLKSRVIDPAQRAMFAAQLELAAEFRRPVVLHGAKCWGQVVAACRPYAGRIPSFLFHGFSRSSGLLPDIAALNGFVGVGAALLNDHAVNYRELVKEIPLERLLVETDADYDSPLKRQECRFPDRRPHIGEAALSPLSSFPDRRPHIGEAALSPLSPTPGDILSKLAEIRGVEVAALEVTVDANAARFVEVLA